MIAKILISPDLDSRIEKIKVELSKNGLKKDHPDVLYFDQDEKLGVESAKKIREHLSLKPYQAKGRGVVVISANNFTPEAQNSLLKTLEEPPYESVILLGANSDSNFLPTILSRCQIIKLDYKKAATNENQFITEIERLRTQNMDERFQFIEKLEEKEEFLKSLVSYFRNDLIKNPKNVEFAKLLLQAEQWESANVNLRAILEYLMLNLPKT